MGDRANYAIVRRGQLSVFYAHWGGPTVPRELARGPLACERFIRAQKRERGPRLLEFSFMEGGIALDIDTRRALVFGGPGAVNYDPAVQARLLERLRPLWPGWTLTWARRYAYDFVAFLGIDGAAIETDYDAHLPATWEHVVAVDDDRRALVARRDGERWDLRVIGVGIGQAIGHGERLLAEFTALRPAEDLTPRELQDIGALLFDESTRRLVIVAPLFASLNAPHHLARRARAQFPEWTVELDLDLDPPRARLAARGLPITTVETTSNPGTLTAGDEATNGTRVDPPEPADELADIDALLDRVLALAPEAEIERLTGAATAAIADIVRAADERGEAVIVHHNEPRPPPARRTRKPPWHGTPRGRSSRRRHAAYRRKLGR